MGSNQMNLSVKCPYCGIQSLISPEICQRCHIELGINTQLSFGVPVEWRVGICANCHLPVIIFSNGRIQPPPQPEPSDPSIPEYIKKNFDESKICFVSGAYLACATMARRTIESICNNKGATQGKLFDKINWMKDSGYITKNLSDWATQLRLNGNIGAHPNDTDININKTDAENLLELLKGLLDDLYVRPAIRHRLQINKKE